MIVYDAYIVGIHRYCFRAGEPARIVGVDVVKSAKEEPRPCYHVQWSDKVEDWIPMMDGDNYKIISMKDIVEGNIPEVTK